MELIFYGSQLSYDNGKIRRKGSYNVSPTLGKRPYYSRTFALPKTKTAATSFYRPSRMIVRGKDLG